jgi:hypothetical protein
MLQILLVIRKHGSLKVHECCFVWLYIEKKCCENNIHFVWTNLVWKPYLIKLYNLKRKCMWFDIILVGYLLIYATNCFVVVCCVVNQFKTCKKKNDKTTWWKNISNVVKFDLHILIVSCISSLVLYSSLCKSIHYSLFGLKS